MEQKPSPNYYAAVVVINSDGKVLLGKRKEDGIWTTPGGSSEPGEENPAKTASRELFEEAGIPANSAFLQPVEAIQTRNGKLCHVFLYVCGASVVPTSKLDPDEEVGKWKWFSMDELPNGLKDDPRRFQSVRNGYMKFYGINKSLIDSLEKGGKPAAVGEVRNFGGVQYQKMGNGEWRPYQHPEEKQLEAEQNKNKVVSLTDKLKQKVEEKKQVSASEQHLSDLKNQAVVPGQQTRSEKPVFTNVDAALAHGYDAKDFREVGNFFYDRAQKTAENIEKLKRTGQKVDPNFEKIQRVNLQYSRAFIGQANRIDDRQAKTKASMTKSTVMMGHADAAEVKTSDFAIDHRAAAETQWLDRMSLIMDGYQYGDEPRIIALDAGDLYLVKVDDGMYSGVFKKIDQTDDGALLDNAKVRIERMTLPSLIQFCIAKEWIHHSESLDPAVNAGQNYAAMMDYYGGNLEASDLQDKTVDALMVKLEAPVQVPVDGPLKVESNLDKLLRLVDKLTN